MRQLPVPRSLQMRLQLWVLLMATLVWVGAALMTWFDAQHEIDELLDGHLTQSAALLVLQADDADDDISDVPILHKYVPQVAFQVFIGQRLVTRSPNIGTTPLSDLRDGFATVRQPDGQTWRIYSTYNRRRNVTVMVAENLESRKSILWAIIRSMLRPMAIAYPLFGAVVWWSVRQGLAPMYDLRRLLGRRDPHATEPVPTRDMPRELRPLVQALNGLFDRIRDMVALERRFTADAAHELRTPIAAIRAQAQVALSANDMPQERAHALHQTLAGCDSAARLVAQLLTLARLEAAPASNGIAVDLGAVVRHIGAEKLPQAMVRQQQLELAVNMGTVVHADETLLGVLVRNLIDNALRYSSERALVRVVVGLQPAGCVEMLVEDSGPGMSEEAISHLGERFFRVLGSGQPGSGLGWSIVSRLVQVFGAQVEIGRSVELGGLSVRVRWPRLSPQTAPR